MNAPIPRVHRAARTASFTIWCAAHNRTVEGARGLGHRQFVAVPTRLGRYQAIRRRRDSDLCSLSGPGFHSRARMTMFASLFAAFDLDVFQLSGVTAADLAQPWTISAETRRAQSFRFSLTRRSRGQISRWRLQSAPAGRVRALRGDWRSDPARGTQILERGASGGIRDPRGRAQAAVPRASEVDSWQTQSSCRSLVPQLRGASQSIEGSRKPSGTVFAGSRARPSGWRP